MAVKEEKKRIRSAPWNGGIAEYLNIGNEQLKSKSKPRSKYSVQELSAEKAYTCALVYQRSRSKGKEPIKPWSSSSGSKLESEAQKDTFLENEAAVQQYSTKQPDEVFRDTGLRESLFNDRMTKRIPKTGDLSCESELFVLKYNIFADLKEDFDNVILYVDRDNDNEMITLINGLKIDTPICTLPDQTVIATHLDDVCGLGKVETTNTWTVSLLPNCQVRLENEGCCYRIRPGKAPTFHDKNVIVEGCLVPGGHLFRLTFALKVSDEERIEWLTIKDKRYICNKPVLDYMVTHPFESLESIRSKLCIAFITDPYHIDSGKTKVDVTEPFDCYYCQRHLIYRAIDREYVGYIKIEKWGARGDIRTLFFTSETDDSVKHEYLMAVATDMAWYRAWKATIYADIKNPEDYLNIGKKHTQTLTPLKADFLAISSFEDESDQYITSKFVFDYATRQFSSVNLVRKRDCFAPHRIIARPSTDKRSYDFRVTGCSVLTKEVVDLKIRVVIPSNRDEWEAALPLPFVRVYAFIDMVLSELTEKDKTLCDIDTEEVSTFSFDKVAEFISVLPKVEVLGSALSCLRAHHLENLALLTFDALYRPLLSLEAAEKIVESANHRVSLEDICGADSARLIYRVHRHFSKRSTDDTSVSKKKGVRKQNSKLDAWRRVLPRFLRFDDFQQVEHDTLIENLAEYFDNLVR